MREEEEGDSGWLDSVDGTGRADSSDSAPSGLRRCALLRILAARADPRSSGFPEHDHVLVP